MTTNFMGSYTDLRAEVYQRSDLERIAKRIWLGHRQQGFIRSDDVKWCDAPSAGVNMRRALFVDTIANWQHLLVREWLNVGDFEIKIDTSCRGDYPGRIFVRRPTEDSR
jgi:hypothetical protein